MRVAEERSTTPVVVWLDGAALIVEPLVDLRLPDGAELPLAASRSSRRFGAPRPPFDLNKFSCEVVGGLRAAAGRRREGDGAIVVVRLADEGSIPAADLVDPEGLSA